MKDFIQKLLNKAKEQGLVAECFMQAEDTLQSTSKGREQTGFEANSTQSVGFRVLIDGKIGYASTEAFDDEAIDMLLRRATESATLSEMPDEQFIYEGAEEYPTIVHNEAGKMADTSYLFAVNSKINDIAHAYDARIEKVSTTFASTTKERKILANTYGMYLEHEDVTTQIYSDVTAKDGEEIQTAYEFAVKRVPESIDLEALSKSMCKKALDSLGADSVPSGMYSIIFDNAAMTSLLSVFSSIFSAEAAQNGLSLLAGKEGERIASEAVQLIDEPHRADAFQSIGFDDEGVPTYNKAIIKNGVLQTLLHNLKTAHKAGVKSTGNASGGGKVKSFNLHFAPGTKSPEELLQDMSDGIVIQRMDGLHAGANPISGDFSLLAKGYLVKDGKPAGAVSQITVAGNFYQLLKDIIAFGNDLAFFYGAKGSPSCYVGKLSVAGK